VATIVTAVAAEWAYSDYRCKARQKRLRLERYLVSAALALSEADILQTAFANKNTNRVFGATSPTARRWQNGFILNTLIQKFQISAPPFGLVS
jgi:hypothetical protein